MLRYSPFSRHVMREAYHTTQWKTSDQDWNRNVLVSRQVEDGDLSIKLLFTFLLKLGVVSPYPLLFSFVKPIFLFICLHMHRYRSICSKLVSIAWQIYTSGSTLNRTLVCRKPILTIKELRAAIVLHPRTNSKGNATTFIKARGSSYPACMSLWWGKPPCILHTERPPTLLGFSL